MNMAKRLLSVCYVSIVARPMASSDDYKLKENQERLGWVAPTIGLLEAEHTLGKQFSPPVESTPEIGPIGPS